MIARTKKKIIKKYEEEESRQTQTLWDNEVEANLFVARILAVSSVVALVFVALALFGFFPTNKNRLIGVMLQAAVLALIGAGVSYYFKGQKKWLKFFLLFLYIGIFARAETVIGHGVYLLVIFPIALSVRYYSQTITIGVSVLTLLAALIADYLCICKGMGIIDYNYVKMIPGTILNVADSSASTADLSASIDIHATWLNFLWRSYVPRYILTSMASIICGIIARKGREAIFSQQAETKKAERISTELTLASSIQANMLPNIFPAFPDRKDFDIYATMTPAKEVGGDFYDFFMVDEDHLAIVIADVSGKGIPAAMFMVIAKTLIKDHAQLGLSPSKIFTRVNDLLCEGNEVGLFVTAWMGIIDLKSGKMSYANAGHNPPVIKKNGIVSYLHCKPGFVLAGLEGYQYKEYELDLQMGDKIFLYTDGVTEATNATGELYGEDRLMNCILGIDPHMPCASVLHMIRQDVDIFVGDSEQFDDLTMLAFDYSPKDINATLERTFDAVDDKLHEVLAFAEQALEEHEADMKATMAITVALEEMFVNICHYAYPEKPGKVTVGMSFHHDKIYIYLVDNGIPFNPLENDDPDIDAKLEDRQIGGLGIYMVKKSMDSCRYERKGTQNRFIMSRRIKG